MTREEILIGRKVGNDNYNIDEKYTSVSQIHAKLIRKPDGIYIEDMESRNGTYVNGMQVRAKKIGFADKIFLGGTDYFQLDLSKVVKLLPLSDDDFKQGILKLKKIYDDYQTQSSELQAKRQADMMTKRTLPTTVLSSLTGILAIFLPTTPTTKIIIGISGAILSTLVFLVATKWASKSMKANIEKLNHLNEDYELEYVCPNCGTSFRGRSWEFLKRMGKCPSCRREFNIEK